VPLGAFDVGSFFLGLAAPSHLPLLVIPPFFFLDPVFLFLCIEPVRKKSPLAHLTEIRSAVLVRNTVQLFFLFSLFPSLSRFPSQMPARVCFCGFLHASFLKMVFFPTPLCDDFVASPLLGAGFRSLSTYFSLCAALRHSSPPPVRSIPHAFYISYPRPFLAVNP